jgi:hypothetical protein
MLIEWKAYFFVPERKNLVIQNSLACGAQQSRCLNLVPEDRNKFILRNSVLLISFSSRMKDKFQTVNSSCDIGKATTVFHITTT